RLNGDRFVFEGGGSSLKVQPRSGNAELLGVRPEKISIVPADRAASDRACENLMSGVVELVSFLGPSTEFRVKVAGDRSVLVQQSNRDTAEAVQIGQAVTLSIPPEWCFLFASDQNASGTAASPA